jgi:hypothetical protein
MVVHMGPRTYGPSNDGMSLDHFHLEGNNDHCPVPVDSPTAAAEAPSANRLTPRRAAAPGKEEEENLGGVSSGKW